jgi:uncharacterized protein
MKFQSFEIRNLEIADDAGSISGYAAIYDSLSQDLGGFREKIAPGAFGELDGKDVRALWNHDPQYVLGRTVPQTLRVRPDDVGLYFEIDAPDTSWARDLLVSMKRGDVNQMSFGFDTLADEWQNDNGGRIRTLQSVELYEISVVTFPAYLATSATARAVRAAMNLEDTRDQAVGVTDDDAQDSATRWLLDDAQRRITLLEID